MKFQKTFLRRFSATAHRSFHFALALFFLIMSAATLGRAEEVAEPVASPPEKSTAKTAKPEPLFADETPITEGQWARLLSERLGLANEDESLAEEGYVDLLSGTGARTWEAEDYKKDAKYLVEEKSSSGMTYMEAKSLSGTLKIKTFAPRAGRYPLKVRSRGTLLLTIGDQTLVVENPEDQKDLIWKSLGEVDLQGGENEINVVVSRASAVDAFQIDSRCTNPIMPAGGWHVGDGLNYGEKSETMIKAMGQEGGLPEDNSYLQVLRATNVRALHGDYEKINLDHLRQSGPTATQARENENYSAVRARASAADLTWNLNLPADGVYSFAVMGAGTAPFAWNVDACDIARHVPEYSEPQLTWQEVTSRSLAKGTHVLQIQIPAGGVVQSVRIIRRKDQPKDYYDLLLGLGFSEGGIADNVTAHTAQANLENEFFKKYLHTPPGEQPGGNLIPPPPAPPVFIGDEDFPFGSPTSPLLPIF